MEYHIHCSAEDIARYVFVPGDPDRAKQIVEHFDSHRLVNDHRGLLVYTGLIDGIEMTVAATGMGGPTTAIVLEELGHLGADTFIRVGSCGTLQPDITCGDIIIATGSYRGGGTSIDYLPLAFPAVADFHITQALVEAAGQNGLHIRLGLGMARDAFYAPREPQFRKRMAQAGLLSAEMESDTLFILASLRGWRAGALYACDGTSTEIKPEWGREAFRQGEEHVIAVARRGMLAIAAADNRD